MDSLTLRLPAELLVELRQAVWLLMLQLLPSGSIYGFNVSASKAVLRLAEKKGVRVHLHTVIYTLLDSLKDELSSLLPPCLSHNILGKSCYTVHLH